MPRTSLSHCTGHPALSGVYPFRRPSQLAQRSAAEFRLVGCRTPTDPPWWLLYLSVARHDHRPGDNQSGSLLHCEVCLPLPPAPLPVMLCADVEGTPVSADAKVAYYRG